MERRADREGGREESREKIDGNIGRGDGGDREDRETTGWRQDGGGACWMRYCNG